MIKITTKVGILFMETEDERAESDRIKIYDSQSRYLEYLPLERLLPNETIKQYCDKVVHRLGKCDTVEEILNYLGIDSYTIGESWMDLLEDIYGFDGYEYDLATDKYTEVSSGCEITEQSVLNNYCVNIVGDAFVLNCD